MHMALCDYDLYSQFVSHSFIFLICGYSNYALWAKSLIFYTNIYLSAVYMHINYYATWTYI